MKTSERSTVLVAGGGLVGLTVAHALRSAGHDVQVFERRAAIGDTGASLTLWPPTSSVFERYGLLDAIREHADAGDLDTLHDPSGRVLARRPFEPAVAHYDHPMYTIYRPTLNRVLARPLDASIRCDVAVVSFSEDADGVTALLSDGATARGDVLIGADGVGSAIRRQMFPDVELIDARYASWRAVLPRTHLELGENQWVDGARETRGGFLRAGDGRVFWGISQKNPVSPDPAGPKVEALAHLEHLDDGGWGWPMRALIEETPPELVTRSDVVYLPKLERWVTGRIALIGDAAHAMPPHVASGAAYGIEDAYVLGVSCERERDIGTALAAYEAERLDRMAWVFDEADAVMRASNYGAAWAGFVVGSLARGPQPEEILAQSVTVPPRT